MKSNITVIIPVHKLDVTTKPLLENAIKSVSEQIVKPEELLIVIPADEIEIFEYVKTFKIDDVTIRCVSNKESSDFCNQMNVGVEEVKTDYFSYVEFDDELSKIWIKNGVEYIKAYPNVSVFLPLIIDVNPEGGFIGLSNEVVWANQFSDELGYLDENSLLTYQSFNTSGMIMKTDAYKECGGFKSKIIGVFGYEFLLRLARLNYVIMTLPKFGYKHTMGRPGSIIQTCKETMAPDEIKWWVAQAKKEYYYNYDRAITYQQ